MTRERPADHRPVPCTMLKTPAVTGLFDEFGEQLRRQGESSLGFSTSCSRRRARG